MLAEAIERLLGGTARAFEQHAPAQSVLLSLAHLGNIDSYLAVGDTERLEGLAVFRLLEQRLAIGIEKRYLARLHADGSLHASGLNDNLGVLLTDRELRLGLLRHNHQALGLLGQLSG